MTTQCRYAKSDMTPCVLKDGAMCFAFGDNDEPICVGCERTPKQLGVPRPADWDDKKAEVAAQRARSQRRRRPF